MKIFSLIGIPLGWIMWVIYDFVGNYGLTLLLFTLLMKLIMLPLAIKQQKGLVQMASFKPKMDELKKKYANNQKKLNEEMMELYKKENYSPTASCLPTLLQFPILFGLIDVIYYPLKHIVRLPADTITKAVEVATTVLGEGGMNRYSSEISVLQAVHQDAAPFVSALGADVAGQLSSFDFSFLGLNLGLQPHVLEFTPLFLWLIPILSGLSSLLMTLISMKQNKGISSGDNTANAMLYMMPLMSVWISYQVPAGVGIYWLLSNLFSALQSFVLYKVYNPTEMAEKARLEIEQQRERERQDRIAARKQGKKQSAEEILFDEDADEEAKNQVLRTLSQKELNRIKLARARKMAAEKYGDEFVDVTDEDLK